MAEQVLDIADKTTLDEVYANLTDSEIGLAAIKASLESGGGGNKVKYANEITTNSFRYDVSQESVSTLPYAFCAGSAVVYNNEIHLIGSYGAYSIASLHYKWDGTSWTSDVVTPYSFYYGCAVVYNNEIHILGGGPSTTTTQYHYKLSGSSWVSVSTLPYGFYQGSAVVYNNEIHILGGSDTAAQLYHYKWNGTSWTSASTLTQRFTAGCAVVYNNEIHLMGCSSNNQYHCRWDGSTWMNVGAFPYVLRNGNAVVHNNAIHVMSTDATANDAGYPYREHFKLEGYNWTFVGALPYAYPYNAKSVVYNNRIHLLGGATSSDATTGNTNHYIVASSRYSLCLTVYLLSGSKIYCNTNAIMPISASNIIECDDGWECSADGKYQFALNMNDTYYIKY